MSKGPLCLRQAHSYGATDQAPRFARQFVADALCGLPSRSGDVVGDAALVASELVTNAVNAGATEVTVHVAAHHRVVEVVVDDDADAMPHPRPTSTSDVDGRGLPVVSALSADWGVERARGDLAHKSVWATLPVTPAFTAADLNCDHPG
jgi:anti-sigma regulatory factor (Ser/Thr protein kinase)